jgi:anti-anti-sigma regulatory factor
MIASNTKPSEHDAQAEALIREALQRLDSSRDEVVLDFSAVRRIDPAALRAMQQLAAKARDNSVKVVLRGVDVGVYKVLKLVAVATDFSFRT